MLSSCEVILFTKRERAKLVTEGGNLVPLSNHVCNLTLTVLKLQNPHWWFYIITLWLGTCEHTLGILTNSCWITNLHIHTC